LARAEELGNRPERGRAHLGLARAHRDLGASEAARDHGKQAWDTFRDLGVREIETAQAFLDGLE
jgi:hypothetical protein